MNQHIPANWSAFSLIPRNSWLCWRERLKWASQWVLQVGAWVVCFHCFTISKILCSGSPQHSDAIALIFAPVSSFRSSTPNERYFSPTCWRILMRPISLWKLRRLSRLGFSPVKQLTKLWNLMVELLLTITKNNITTEITYLNTLIGFKVCSDILEMLREVKWFHPNLKWISFHLMHRTNFLLSLKRCG